MKKYFIVLGLLYTSSVFAITGFELILRHNLANNTYTAFVEGVIDATYDRRICMTTIPSKQYTTDIFKWLIDHNTLRQHNAVELIRSAAMDLYPCSYIKDKK